MMGSQNKMKCQKERSKKDSLNLTGLICLIYLSFIIANLLQKVIKKSNVSAYLNFFYFIRLVQFKNHPSKLKNLLIVSSTFIRLNFNKILFGT